MQHKILAVGEVLFDVIEDEYKLGGAPFNVAAHMAKLGHHSYILSSVGEDRLGDRIIQEAEELNVRTDLIVRQKTRPTGTVLVTFEDGEPQYEIVRDVAWDFLEADFNALRKMQWKVLAFGSLAQRSAHNQDFYANLFRELEVELIYFDCNLRQHFFNKIILENSLGFAHIAKFNAEEIRICSRLLYKVEMGPTDFARRLQADYQLDAVLYTLGKDGAQAWYQGEMVFRPAVEIEIADTIGAGDAFNAGFLDSWMAEAGIEEALEHGNRLGAFVASRKGAIPDYDAEIQDFFQK